MSLDRC